MDWWTSLAAIIALLWICCFIDGKSEYLDSGDLEDLQELEMWHRKTGKQLSYISQHKKYDYLSLCVKCLVGCTLHIFLSG